MAWYQGIYKCGHEGKVNIFGPSKEREKKSELHFSGLCPDCYKKQLEEEREKENKEAAERSKKMDLPELTGTEKQIAWANTLRIKAIDDLYSACKKMEDMLTEKKLDVIPDINIRIKELFDSVEYFIQKHTDAKYWIESRDNKINLKNLVNDYIETIAHEDVEEEIIKEKEDLTVYPSCISKSGIVKIEILEKVLSIEYVKNFDFIEIVKKFRYKWNGISWGKEITEYTGKANDLAAEIGNNMLLSGFSVQFPNQESKEKAISGNFIAENDRWIKYNSSKNHLCIEWKNKNYELYDIANKLPGAKWKDGYMSVNLEFYREVEDFAKTMGFSISKRAQSEIEKYKQKESMFELVNISSPVKEYISDKEKLEKSLKSGGTIIEDLTDD